jgi:hypothetical protein
MSLDVERRQSTDGSADESGSCVPEADGAMSIDSRRFTLSRSNGANVAKTLRAALEALGVGRVDVARELLSELLESTTESSRRGVTTQKRLDAAAGQSDELAMGHAGREPGV